MPQLFQSGTEELPVYCLKRNNAESPVLPLIVSVCAYDEKGVMIQLPCLRKAINTAVRKTGKEGILQGKINDMQQSGAQVNTYVEKAFAIGEGILLLHCASAEVAEALMPHLAEQYSLSLLK